MKGQQPGHALQGAFGKEQRSLARCRQFRNPAGIFHPLFGIEPLDKEGVEAGEQGPGKQLAAQLRLGNEIDRTGQNSGQDQAVDTVGLLAVEQNQSAGRQQARRAVQFEHASHPVHGPIPTSEATIRATPADVVTIVGT